LGDRILLLANFLATLGTVGGLVAVWIKWRHYAFVLSAFPVIFPWMYYITLPYLRYRQPIDPILMLLAALALDALLRRESAVPPPIAPAD
jgi:membrane associated rhomboid family serine protease